MIRINRSEKGLLVLEDGTIFSGWSMGCPGEIAGEVIITTGMTGYQEVLTDPSSAGQIVVFTYPLIGNYGITSEDLQSAKVHARGVVVQQSCAHPSNWRSQGPLESFLVEHHVIGLAGVDTRAVARHVRRRGYVRAVIATGNVDPKALVARLKENPDPTENEGMGSIVTDEFTTSVPYTYAEGDGPRITVVDYGVRLSLLRWLAARGCHITVVPAGTDVPTITATRPNGVILSSGPGNPESYDAAGAAVSDLARRWPIFGIGLGHQIIARAFGAETFRLNQGHRGTNHPVKDLQTGRLTMTSQNHGWAVNKDSLTSTELVVSHQHGNDGTVEGLVHEHLPVASVQFYPEGSPGPSDSVYPLEEFLSQLSSEK